MIHIRPVLSEHIAVCGKYKNSKQFTVKACAKTEPGTAIARPSSKIQLDAR